MSRLVLCLVVLVGCTDNPPAGVLNLMVDSHTVVVGQSTSIFAYFDDGKGGAPMAVAASWSTDPSGLVTLSDLGGNYQKVTADAVGQVVVTGTASGESAKTGFTLVSP